MVCIPCIVIPVLLWIFHKFIQPFILKFWNPWQNKVLEIESRTINWDTDKSQEASLIHKMVKTNPVVLFSKTTCNYCNMAKKLLNESGVQYITEEINNRPDCKKLQDSFELLTGERTVPRIFIGGKCIGGSSDACNLQNQGKFMIMLKEANAIFKKEN